MLYFKRLAARRTERWLLIVAAVIVVLARAAVEGALGPQAFTGGTVWFAAGFTAVVVVVHLVVTALAPAADQIIMPCVALLNGMGIVMIGRLDDASIRAAANNPGKIPLILAGNQIKLTLISLVVFVLVLAVVRNHRKLARYSYLLGVAGLVLLILPVIWPFGRPPGAQEAKIWILIGPFSVQPGEFAKICFILFFAKLLCDKRALFAIAGTKRFGIVFPRWRDVAQIVAFWFIAMGVMVAENDFGPVLLLFGTVLVMLYMATGRISWIAIGAVLIAAGAPILYRASAKIQQRVDTVFHPLADPADSTYQASQALFSWAWGGLTGTGLGRGWPGDVPVVHTDYILTAFGEETGLVGVSALIMVFTMIVARGLVAGLAVGDSYGKLVAAGLSVTLMIQLFVVVAGISSLLPMTGLTTPFVSAGGSSLMANYVLVALVMRISDAAGRKHRRDAAVGAPRPGGVAPMAVNGGVR